MALITPTKVKFSAPVMERMWMYVHKQIDFLLQENATFVDTVLPEWTRLLKGIPKSKERNFPFPNAANLVVQLIATRVEQMLSRAMIIYQVDPLWTISATGDIVGQEADEQAKVLEEFMGDMAIDPEELNLYRKEEMMFHDGIAYGTAFMGFPWQYLTEAQATYIPGSDSSTLNRADQFKTLITKDGPSPDNIPLERILISNRVTDLAKAKFMAREVPLTREAVEDRIAFGVWSRVDGEKVLASPDSCGSSYRRIQEQDGKQIYSVGNEYDAEYKIYECYFKFVHDGKTFSIIAHYHKESNTNLSAVFNYFPKNCLPFEDLRFGYDDDSYRGYGFIEMLQGYQEEVSTLHNNRLDNEAIRNNVTLRIDEDSPLASILRWYPGVTIPANQQSVEFLDTHAGSLDNANSENLTTSMANERSGIDPAIGGTGSGIVNQKRGIYSSQGTMAVLQQQNNRTGLRMMDIRGAHLRIGRKLLDLYAFMGIGKRLARYGNQAPTLRKALDSVKTGSIGLILQASSAATNVESDRQNSILLDSLQQKYMQTVQGLMGALKQPQIAEDPAQVQYIQDMLFAQQSLTRHIFRIFGKFDVDKLVPFPDSIKKARAQYEQQSRATSGGANSSNSSGQASSQPSAGITRPPASVIPTANGASTNPVPISAPGQPA